MTDAQRTLASYIVGGAGNCYVLTDFAKRCIVGMLQTGEITESDFNVITGGERWLQEIKTYANKMGWNW